LEDFERFEKEGKQQESLALVKTIKRSSISPETTISSENLRE